MTTQDPQETAENGDRDAKTGQFLRGNQAARGHANARNKIAGELRRALHCAVADGNLDSACAALVERANSGDTTALRLLFEYLAGRSRVMPDDDAQIDLGDLSTAAGAAAALRSIAVAAGCGAVDVEQATSLAALVRSSIDASIVADLEERLEKLEREGPR